MPNFQHDLLAGQQLHQDPAIFTTGVALETAKAAMILLHGRGTPAQDILQLAAYFANRDMAYLAPQAAGNSWWPNRFMDPLERNEPWLSSALQVIDDLMQTVTTAGVPGERLILAGFSQGACLAAEYVYLHPQRYGGLFIFSGGLIGPPGSTHPAGGSLEETPIFIGCSDIDPHIPLERVDETAVILSQMNGRVTKKIYPGMAHTITAAELEAAQRVGSDLFLSQ
jgi:predicted esterase